MTNSREEVESLTKKWRAMAEKNKEEEKKLMSVINTVYEMQQNPVTRDFRYKKIEGEKNIF